MRILLVLILCSVQAAFAAKIKIDFPVVRYQLDNGLTVLLHEDHSVPMISYHTWYRVGSRDESIGVTGAAHMLEHMMFKGADKYDGKDFDRILHENGVYNNAFTNYDYTGFYENLPSSKLELIMDMELDRMSTLAIKQSDLTSELQVVGEERRWRVDNNPTSLLRESFMDTVYKVHPYRWPVIGYMKDIQAYTSEKLRHFYETYYVPNNAVLVIAGDFKTDEAKALVEKYYGKLKAKPLPPKNYPQEPEQKAPQRVVTEGEVQSSTVMIGYKGVASGHEDSYALDLASSILSNGTSSRLYKKLVYQKQNATSAGGYNMTLADPGVFLVVATLKPGKSVNDAENDLRTEVRKLIKERVTGRELQKVKNQVMNDFVQSLTTIEGKAQSLAVNEIIFGSYEKLFTDLEKYDAVTVEDIQRVAKKYLKPNAEVVAILNPKTK